MEEFKTKDIYVVKPSIITYDESELLHTKKDELSILHTIKFMYNEKNINIAIRKNSLYRTIDNKYMLYKDIPRHSVEGDMYIGVVNNDSESIINYLYKKEKHLPKLNYLLYNYLVGLKPTYTKDELLEILDILKE